MDLIRDICLEMTLPHIAINYKSKQVMNMDECGTRGNSDSILEESYTVFSLMTVFISELETL